MNLYSVALFILFVNKLTHGTDPSACQRAIKYMLITACGATKREFHDLPVYPVMTEEEIEDRYRRMVLANMIKGVGPDCAEPFDGISNHLDEAHYRGQWSGALPCVRAKRDVLGLGIRMKDRTYAEATAPDKRGSFHFIGRLPSGQDEDRSPLPGVLKAKCCGGRYLCSMDDFKGFCE